MTDVWRRAEEAAPGAVVDTTIEVTPGDVVPVPRDMLNRLLTEAGYERQEQPT